jgi:LysM repeat protein
VNGGAAGRAAAFDRMRLSLTLSLACFLSVLAGCGAGSKTNGTSASSQPTDPKAVPTATLPSVLPSPIPASTVTEAAITGQASSGPTTYTVKSGDTMAGIAQTVGVPLNLLQSYNTDVNPSRLIVGQQIRVPPPPSATPIASTTPLRPATPTPPGGSSANRTTTPGAFPTSTGNSTPARSSGSSTPSSSASSQTYAVQPGDSACNIAAKFSITLQELATANGETVTSIANLKPGQLLKIPTSSGSPRGC